MAKPQQKDFQMEMIKILRDVADGERGTRIAIVRWIVDGRAFSPQLVNQEIYTDRINRQRKVGKNKGLNAGDWVFLMNFGVEKIRDMLIDYTSKKPAPLSGQDAAANDYADEVSTAAPASNPPDEEIPF